MNAFCNNSTNSINNPSHSLDCMTEARISSEIDTKSCFRVAFITKQQVSELTFACSTLISFERKTVLFRETCYHMQEGFCRVCNRKLTLNFCFGSKKVVKSSSNVAMKVRSALEFNGADVTTAHFHLAHVTSQDVWKFPTFRLNTVANTSARLLDIQRLQQEAPLSFI